MPVAVAVWSVAVKPGEQKSIIPPSDLRITNVALGDELADQSKRTAVKLTYTRPVHINSDEEDEEEESENESENEPLTTTILCSLTPGKIENSTLDIVLEENEEFLFEVAGPNTVYLTGNYIDQAPDQVPYNDDSEPDSDEEAFDLRDVSSDVEMDPYELGSDDESRFEEIEDELPKKAAQAKASKRPRESNDMEVEGQAEKQQSKSQKKQNKKLKGENGAAVPAGEEPNTATPAEGQKSAQKKKEDKKDKEKAKAGGASAEVKVLQGDVKIKDVKVGHGPAAKKGSKVAMRYIGKLDNGKIFDENKKGTPFSFKLGSGEVIKGWDLGIEGMRVGGERLLIVPPKMGYGSKRVDVIPPNSTLTFEVKLISLK